MSQNVRTKAVRMTISLSSQDKIRRDKRTLCRKNGSSRRINARTRAKSNADFISKIEGSLQELEETEYWLELLGEAGFFPKDGLAAVRKETGELKGIFVSIVINTKAKSKPSKS